MGSFYEQNQNINVLLVTPSAPGHLNPILRLGKSLVSKGLHVTLITNEYPFKDNTMIGGVRLEFFSDGLPLDYNRKADLVHSMDMISKFGPGSLLAFIRSRPNKFAYIIHTPFLPWVSDVAAEVGVPNAMLWIQPCTVYQIYHHYYNRLEDFPTESELNMNVKLPGLPVFRTDDLPSFVLPTNTFASFGSVLKKLFCSMHKVKWVLGNSFMELEKDVTVAINNTGRVFWPVGPIVPATLLGKEEDFDLTKSNEDQNNCIEWLDKQKPSSVVYISFGTLLYWSEKEIQSIAAGLKKINRPFLWVILMSPSYQQLPKLEILEEIKEQGLIVSWSPQSAVLSHPSVGCFLSHCGWNSLLETITAGVPVIACPHWTDQPTNAKLVTDVWRVGVKLNKNSEGFLDGEEVRRCVEEVMSGQRSKEFTKNALDLKSAARQALVNGGSSYDNIQMFVNEIISSCSDQQ
ncbi:UDP-glycosyltransferase 84B1-like [Bidens hawaiensis]|uniref:UDP-glycosyltransferase 84B1-like n=1 Tax=Bidens hawaiensis TaxID=980011 RepID=UPI0040493069